MTGGAPLPKAPARERPILFSGPMVRAILEDRKTMTRRVVTAKSCDSGRRPLGLCAYNDTVEANDDGEWAFLTAGDHGYEFVRCPYGQPGDRLHVQETWAVGKCADGLKPTKLDPPTWLGDNGGLWYAADGATPAHPISERGKWRPGRFMPGKGKSWASRIPLEITEVRVERLQEITRADVEAEGVELAGWDWRGAWQRLWNDINAKRGYGWDVNPWVWVIGFRRIS